jgi:hypothetical protein
MAKPVAKPKPYPTEVDLCDAFLALIPKEWTAYPETAGWDILLVRKEDGFQIGIEAKLRLKTEVINQAIEEYGYIGCDHAGPDCRAVLVPDGDDGGFNRIAAYIGFTIIRMNPSDGFYGRRPSFRPTLPKIDDRYSSVDYWHEWAPTKRHQLPEYVPDVRAGSPAPIQLTSWKISALKLQATLEANGFLTRSDFRTFGLDHRRWLAREFAWLQVSNDGWVKGPHFPDFGAQHPIVFAQVKADLAEQARKMEKPLKQAGLLL